jgi:hypothetical protein
MNGANSCHLLAGTGFGPLRMSIPLPPLHGGRERFDNLDVAAALARCEPLLRELEGWLQGPLDPSPVHASLPAAPGLALTITDASLALPGTVCRLPWVALRRGPPPQRLLGSHCEWPMLRCEVELARYDAAPAARSAMRAGTLLLLPQAFQPVWGVHLYCADDNAGMDAQRCLSDGSLRPLTPLHDALAPHADWRVVLDSHLDVPAPWAMGWQAAPLSVPAGADRARLLGPGPQPWAEGTIAPALQGAALWIDRRCDDNEDAMGVESLIARELADA